LADGATQGLRSVFFLHCYPSDLKQGGRELLALLREYVVLLLDTGHTHYDEIANDEEVLYTATRSTGQVEEGLVGYSVTTLDAGVLFSMASPTGFEPVLSP
jgi:3',5'-cyclic-AMP phosphodiesterase